MYKYIALTLLFFNTLSGVGNDTFSENQIHQAAKKCDPDLIESVATPQNINQKDTEGFPPLYYAICCCEYKPLNIAERVIGVLLQKGANPYQQIGETTVFQVAVISAAILGHSGPFIALLKNNANPYDKRNWNHSVAEMAKFLSVYNPDSQARLGFQNVVRIIEQYWDNFQT